MSFKLPNIGKHLSRPFSPLRAVLCVVLIASTSKLVAQETPAKKENLGNWFGSYTSNQYVTRLSVNPKVIERIRNNKHLFQFGIYYISLDSLNSASPQLNIGFFASPDKARQFLGSNQFAATKSTSRIPQSEHSKVLSQYRNPNADSKLMVFYLKGQNREKNSKIILDQARALYVEGKYQQSLIAYLLLSVFSEGETAAWSRELAGLSYEKQGKLEQAVLHYRQLLKDFPEAAGKQRVEQRLRALETAASNDKTPRTKPNNGKDSYGVFYRGVLSHNIRSMTKTVNEGDSEDILSIQSNDFDLRASKRGKTHEFSFRTNGFLVRDGLDRENSTLLRDRERDYNRLRRAFVSYNHRPSGFDAVLGRQREYNSGVFTSFDGITLSYPVLKPLRVSVSTGSPVYFTPFYDGLDYNFVSLHSELDVGERWQFNTYLTQQTVNDITDREAVGFRTSFRGENLTSSLVVDYDIAFSELNSLLFNGFYRLGSKTKFNLTYGQQRAPFLTATNVFIGRVGRTGEELNIEEYLQSQENTETILEDALDRTSLSTYQTLSVRQGLDDNFEVIFDYYQSTLSEVPSSEFLLNDDVLRTTDTFDNQSYGLRLLAQRIFSKGDILNLGVRQGESDQGESTLVFLNERLRFGRRFSIQPRLSYLTLKFNNGESEQQRTRYSLFLSFRPTRNTELSLEAGDETTNTDSNQQSFNTRYYFGGFRINF